MSKPPFSLSLFLTLMLLGSCAYFWFLSSSDGRLPASAFCLIGLATYGTYVVMDLIIMYRKRR
jgi:hypothetical protein